MMQSHRLYLPATAIMVFMNVQPPAIHAAAVLGNVESILTTERRLASISRAWPLSNGSWVVAAPDRENPERQGIFVLNHDGKIARKIGAYGESPGMYSRIADILVDPLGQIWSTDFSSPRISVFSPSGSLVKTIIVPKVQFLRNMWLDSGSNKLYVSGCHYLKDGDSLSPCQMLHEIDIYQGQYLGSFVNADPRGTDRGFYRYGIESMARDTEGIFWLAEEGFFQVYRYDPKAASVKVIQVKSAIARPPEPFPTHVTRDDVERALKTYSRIDRIFSVSGLVIVGVNRPSRNQYLLQILDRNGRQIGTDLQSPGTPIGAAAGALYFARSVAAGTEIVQAKVFVKNSSENGR
jgi:hypothetical protein